MDTMFHSLSMFLSSCQMLHSSLIRNLFHKKCFIIVVVNGIKGHGVYICFVMFMMVKYLNLLKHVFLFTMNRF